MDGALPCAPVDAAALLLQAVLGVVKQFLGLLQSLFPATCDDDAGAVAGVCVETAAASAAWVATEADGGLPTHTQSQRIGLFRNRLR